MLYRHIDLAASMAISFAVCPSSIRKAPPMRIPYRSFSFQIPKCFAARTLARRYSGDKGFLNSLFLSFQGVRFRRSFLRQVDSHSRIAACDTMFLRPLAVL
jgi:hypothetical protein